MRVIKAGLLLGGLFNLTMGAVFFNNALLRSFFDTTVSLEKLFFGSVATLTFPSDPMHQLLIHGFGAGVMILGATLTYSARDPHRFLPFILLDGLGRLLYGITMVYSVLHFGLVRMISVFGLIELSFAVTYLLTSWYLIKVPRTRT